MTWLLEIGLSNLVVASALALIAAMIGRCCRRPALTHALWLLVLLKLITPPLIRVPLSLPALGGEHSNYFDSHWAGAQLPLQDLAQQSRPMGEGFMSLPESADPALIEGDHSESTLEDSVAGIGSA